jgi:tight adherence protein C
VNAPSALAVLCGLTLGVGLWLLITMVPRLSRPTLAGRVAPYVIDVSTDARDLLDWRPTDPLPVFALVLAPVLPRVRRLLALVGGGNDLTARRLRQAGASLTVDEFRAKQLIWSAIGAIVATVGDVVIATVQTVPFIVDVATVVVAVAAGFTLRDYALQRAASARVRRMVKELPTVLEFMTLSLSAGEGILDSIRRISRVSSGELSAELATVIGSVSTGVPLVESLESLSIRLHVSPLTRAIEQITGALERGTPLAEVLRAQAQDSRDDAKRELIEVSGKKEVAMLVPLVFLILPTTIIIAIFPGIFVLQLGY